MTITKQGACFVAECSYDEREIPKDAGFRWTSVVPGKWATMSAAFAAKLLTYADETCRGELEAVGQKHTAAIAASRSTAAEIDIPVPDGLEYLPFQRAGIAYALARPSTLMGDEMGLGKTIQVVGVINADPSIRSVLVICPASLKLNWKRELEKWLTREARITIAATATFPSDATTTKLDVVIVNYDIVAKCRPAIDARTWDVLVLDECHYLKNGKAQRTKAVFGKWNRDPEKIEKPIAAKRKLALTGTPIVNRPIELWPIVSALDSSTWRNMMYFAKRYCAATQGRFGWDFSGASNLSELQDKLRSTIMLRRLKADVLTELPAKRRQVIEFTANGTAGIVAREQAAYAAHEAGLIRLRATAELSKAGSDDEYKSAVNALREASTAAFTEMAKIRHEVAIAKIPKVVEYIHDLIDDDAGKKVVVFVHHHDVTDALLAEFPGAARLDGRMEMEDRQANVDSFQTDPACKVFVGSIHAAGVGITLTAADHVVFAELDWTPGNLTQAEDRCHRIGQRNSVLVQHLVLEGSLDAKMAKTLVAKQEVIREALDDDIELPVIPAPTAAKEEMISVSRQAIIAEAETLGSAEIATIHEKLRYLAASCDGARALDGSGFNRYDAPIGHSLASAPALTAKQAALGQRLLVKYRRQLAAV